MTGTLRLIGVGWLMQLKMRSRSAFDGILGNSFLGRYSAAFDQARGVLQLESK